MTDGGGDGPSADCLRQGREIKKTTNLRKQVVKVQKIIRKKFILNPYSAINYNTPELDDVKLELNEVTAHRYTKMGFGEGDGAGFAGGTSDGTVGFVWF